MERVKLEEAHKGYQGLAEDGPNLGQEETSQTKPWSGSPKKHWDAMVMKNELQGEWAYNIQ